MRNILTRLRIGPRLTLGFGILVLLVLLTGAVSLFNNDRATQANNLEVVSNNSALLALNINIQVLEARSREKDFLLRWQEEGFDTAYTNYVVVNQQHMQNVRDLVNELRPLAEAGEETLREALDSIEQATVTYDDIFTHVVEDIQKRGHIDTGLEGEFRTAIQTLEAKPLFSNYADLTVTLLQMRRNEKDYLLRGLQEDVDDTAKFTQILQDQINALPITPDEKSSYIQLTVKYLDKFNELVALDAEIKTETDEFRAAAQSIAPLVETIVTDELAEASAAQADFAQIEAVLQTVTAILLVAALVIGTVLSVFIYRSIVIPMSDVTSVAASLSQGDYSRRSSVTGQDETGFLAQTVNSMADSLEEVISGLEIRTRDLQTVSEVSARVSTILEPERLLRDVADLTKERFRLYHAHIYLADETGQLLTLTAGAGYVGRQMVSEKRTIAMENPQSIVASAARSRKGIIVNDVRESPTFLPHPLLPDTRSELAVPLAARGQLLGVLDVQSNEPGYFNEDNMAVIELMASQIATAISNAYLYETADRSRRHERALGAIERKIQGALTMDEILQTGVRELGKALRVPYTAIEMQLTTERVNGSEEKKA